MNSYRPEGLIGGNDENRALLYSGIDGLERAMYSGTILEAVVTLCDHNMDLHVDLHGIHGIIPKNEVCYNPNGETVKDIAVITRVGKPTCFKVTSIEKDHSGKTVAYLSRRAAQIDCYNNYISDLIPGDIIESRVTHLESFGAFIDVGCGVIALLPVDCISVSRFSHPMDRVSVGMILKTILKSFDHEKGRIFVTLRELLGTWEENAALFSAGQTVSGIIRSVESYGVFVELAPNLAGLAELREGIVNSNDLVGRRASVYIKSIIPERMKIKLVLIDTFKDESKEKMINYFVDTEKARHIAKWKYSPYGCTRIVESVFEESCFDEL